MPIIKSKNNELLREVVYFSQQLKSIVKNGEIIMNDLTRVDLFTEIGIKRQILLLSGAYKVCDFLDKVRVSSETVALKNICFEIRFSDEFFVSIIITQEYLNAVNHYFGKGMRLSILNNSLFCESEAPILASYFYRAILNDIYDHSIDFEGVSFFVTNDFCKLY